jgi:hypothetical protein
MNIGTFAKAIEFSILRDSGVTVSPDQIGLKVKNPELLGTSFLSVLQQTGAFGKIPNTSTATTAYGTPVLPTPPTPPSANASADVQAKYNQDSQTYNQQMQTYNMHMYQMMLSQFNRMQQQMSYAQFQQSQASNNNSASSSSADTGIGGILE